MTTWNMEVITAPHSILWLPLVLLAIDKLVKELREEMKETKSVANRKKVSKRLSVLEGFQKSGNKPYWMMVYYGWVVEGVKTDSVYRILRNALKQMPEDAPFRGPKEYKENGFTYKNTWLGNIEKYSGEEQITQGEKLVYKANYLGGLVDQRTGV